MIAKCSPVTCYNSAPARLISPLRLLATPAFAAVMLLVASAAFSAESNPALGESKLRIEMAGRPLGELASTVGTAVNVDVQVDPDVREWKATIVFAGKAEVLLSHIAQQFRLKLERRQAADGKEQYRLLLPVAERQRLVRFYADRDAEEQERRRADQLLLASAIRTELNILDGKQAAPPRAEGGPLAQGAEPLLRLVDSLGPEALRQLTTPAAPDEMGVADRSPSLVVGVAQLSQQQRANLDAVLDQKLHAMPGGTQTVGTQKLQDAQRLLTRGTLKLWVMPLGRSQQLMASLQVPDRSLGLDFPLIASRTSRSGKKLPAAPEPPTAPEEEQKATYKLDDLAYPEALAELARGAKINVVADAFTLRPHLTRNAKDQPLHEALQEFSKTWDLQRTWEGGVLHCRSREWEQREEQEPAAAVLDHFIPLTAAPDVSLEERLYAVTHLTRPQMRGLGNWHDKGRSLTSLASRLLNSYYVYKWCSSLSPAQLAKVKRGGLLIGALPAKSREQLALLTGQQVPQDARESLAAVRLRADQPTAKSVHLLELLDRDGLTVAEIR